MLVGTISKIRCVPVVAIPPACNNILSGTHSKGGKSTTRILHLFNQESHRESLIQKPQFSLLTLLIARVAKDPAIKKCPMHISHHGSDVASTIWTLWRRRVFDRFQICSDGRMEIHRVPFVERINLAASRNFDLEKKKDTDCRPFHHSG